ncbi:cyclin-dependent kinase 4 inhibitor B [Pygocentrus nattereri]|uniref:Cyclin-dependent kinase inhibitor 2A/B (p15, inhibits CDK4) n=1 Tax=Pygocentrus nattereri TaxID=42514 RepID=A0A3B4C3P2_PYGNA|nr:cyclin-dependent kinase 4 inhibitor B [Pygocentrus nattereri]
MNNKLRDNASDPGMARGGENTEARTRMQDALATAAATGDAARAEELLRNGADVNGTNRFGRTPIQVMMMGSTRVARLLLSYGAEPNVSDMSTGATPLHDAARAGFTDTVRVLLAFKADPERRDKRGRTPADSAREAGHNNLADYMDSTASTKQRLESSEQRGL